MSDHLEPKTSAIAIDVAISLARIKLRKNDRLVVLSEAKLTPEQVNQTAEALRDWLGRRDIPILVLDEGMQIGIIRDEIDIDQACCADNEAGHPCDCEEARD